MDLTCSFLVTADFLVDIKVAMIRRQYPARVDDAPGAIMAARFRFGGLYHFGVIST